MVRSLSHSLRPALPAHLAVVLLLLGGGTAHSETYAYDPAGRLTQVIYPGGTTLGFVYDSRGNLLSRLASAAGTDSDGDGLLDSVESLTGVFVDGSNTGTNPLVADTDGDGAADGEEVALGFDPLDAASTPAPIAAPALSPPGLAFLALLLGAVAFAVVRVRKRSSQFGAFGWWVALAAASGILAPEPAAATCGEVLSTDPGDWNTTNVLASGNNLEASFSPMVGFGSAEQIVDLSPHSAVFAAPLPTTASLSFTLQTTTAGFGGSSNQVQAFVEYDFRSAGGASLESGSRSVSGTTNQAFNVAIADIPSGTASFRLSFAAGYTPFFMAGTAARMLGYSLVINGIDTSVCGDGVAECAEECDDGGLNSDVNPNACRTSCQLPSCGDGVVDTGEACDDDEGCTDECEVEPPPGDGSDSSSNFPQSATTGDPINTYTGELVEGPFADFALGGPTRLSFARRYASSLTADLASDGGLGRGWLHNFELSLDDSSGNAEVRFLWGRLLVFTPASGGGWELSSPQDPIFQLVDDGAERVLLDPLSRLRYRFDATGQLASV